MNHDDAIDEARKVLGDRLNAWGVPEPYRKANAYIEGLTGRGWRWFSGNPQPPRASEACPRCNRYVAACVCAVAVADGDDEQPERPRGYSAEERVPVTDAFRAARAALKAPPQSDDDQEESA